MEEFKKKILKQQICSFIECVINLADREGKLDCLSISIKNNWGQLDMNYSLKGGHNNGG